MLTDLFDQFFPSRKEYLALLERVEKLELEVEATSQEEKKTYARAKAKRVVVKAGGSKENLTEIKGIGPVIQDKLYGAGIFRFAQIAQMSPEEAKAVEQNLDLYSGRIAKENWIAQAKQMI